MNIHEKPTEEEKALQENAKCDYCRKLGKEVLKHRETLPFYNAKSNTFYCGCRGWS